MAPPGGDESLPLEFSASSSTKRHAPTKKNIGIGQFKRQGVAHHFQPGSAAGRLNQQKAELRTEEWLRGAQVDAPKKRVKGKDKKKAKKGGKGKKGDATNTEDAGTEDLAGDASVVAKAPTRKRNIKMVTVDRRIKPTQGTWGQRVLANAKAAAAKAVATTYSTTPITIDVEDGELFATTKPTSKLSTPEPIIPRATVQPKAVLNKTTRKPSMKSRASKKPQAPMWSDSDEDDQNQDETNNSPFSPQTVGANKKTPRTRTTTNSSKSKTPSLRGNPTRDQQSTPQKRKVRFAPTASPEEAEDDDTTITTNVTTTTHQNPKPTPQKKVQTAQMIQPLATYNNTSYNPLTLPQANLHVPPSSQTIQARKQNPSPASFADDEDSQLLPSVQKKMKKVTTTTASTTTSISTPQPAFLPFSASAPASNSASKPKRVAKPKPAEKPAEKDEEQEQEPPRRKGVAGPPLPKRARTTGAKGKPNSNNNANDHANSDDSNDSANDSAGPPARKRTKTTSSGVETDKAAKKQGTEKATNMEEKKGLPAPAPRRKKGIASKPVAKKVRPVVAWESEESDE